MPNIINKLDKNKEKDQTNGNFTRQQFLNKDDVKTTFAYGVVGISVAIALWGVGYSFIKQIQK